MPRYLAVCAALAVVSSVAVAQETKVSAHPHATVSPISAYRYQVTTPFDSCYGENTPIPVGYSAGLLCNITESAKLSKTVEEVTGLALAGSKTISKEDIAVTFIEVNPDNGGTPKLGHIHGNEMRFAAGVSRLFWATALYKNLQDRCISVTPALERDVVKMLHNDDPKATNRLVDYLTGTRSGPSLGYSAFAKFAGKRDYANLLFCSLGFTRFNVNQKLYLTAPSGRDAQLLGEKLVLNYENSNRCTTNQAAGLMYLIGQEAIVSQCASRALKAYMFGPLEQRKVDVLNGVASGLPVGSQIITVNGYTRHNYNEVAHVTLPNGKIYVLSIFSKYRSNPTTFMVLLSRIIANREMTKTGDDDREDYLNIPSLTGQ